MPRTNGSNGNGHLPLQIPNSPEVEAAFVGSMLLDPGVYRDYRERLSPNLFYSDLARQTVGAMQTVWARSGIFDITTISEQLSHTITRPNLTSQLAAMTNGVPIGNSQLVEQHYRGLVQQAVLRALITRCENIKARALSGTDPVDELIEQLGADVSELSQYVGATQDEGFTYQQSARSLLDQLNSPVPQVKVKLGIADVDNMTGGILPTELMIVTAQTGAGKSVIGCQYRREACAQGIHSLYATGEMPKEQVLAREIGSQAEVSRFKLRNWEYLTPADLDRLQLAASHQCPHCRILDGPLSLRRIAAAARRMARSNARLGLIVGDHGGIIDAPGTKELEKQVALAHGFKALITELGVAGILLSQLRKAVNPEDRKNPTLDRIYGSGAITQDASIVMWVDREYVRELKGDQTKGELYILKGRDSGIGRIDTFFSIEGMRFHGVEQVSIP